MIGSASPGYFITVPINLGISPPITLSEKSRPPRCPMRIENLQCAISRGNIERKAFKCTTCPGILETSWPPYCPLRASLHGKGRTSKDEVADQSLRSSIRISCKSSLANYRMLACPKAEIVDPLDKAE
jgi:hypothetical protein